MKRVVNERIKQLNLSGSEINLIIIKASFNFKIIISVLVKIYLKCFQNIKISCLLYLTIIIISSVEGMSSCQAIEHIKIRRNYLSYSLLLSKFGLN